MNDRPEDVQLIYYHGPAGLVTERRVKLHGLDVQGRTVGRVEPGSGGQQGKSAEYGFPKGSPLLLVVVAMLLFLLIDALHWPRWTVYALMLLFLAALIVLVNVRRYQAERRFVESLEVVTVRLDGPNTPEGEAGTWPSVAVRAGQPAPTIPEETVNLVIHDLAPADRWQLVRGWQGYFNMTEAAREQVRAQARAKLQG